MSPPTPQTHQGRRDRSDPASSTPAMDVSRIRFGKPLNPELFNGIAKDAARQVAEERSSNKPTQLRRFYDELMLWESRVAHQPEKFPDYLPFIRMVNAKAAYAKGRKLVDDRFVGLMQHTLKEVTDAESLSICKLFWEAFMGFYKEQRPND
ncbi:MAG: type III-A CRISPR-associated protein Csm2 [Nitrospiraceae bacterium]